MHSKQTINQVKGVKHSRYRQCSGEWVHPRCQGNDGGLVPLQNPIYIYGYREQRYAHKNNIETF